LKLPLLVSALAAAAILVPAASASPAASIRLVDRAPFTVAGANFRPLERVAVTVYSSPATTRRATVSRSGSFQLVFDGVVLSRCSRPQVRAVGAHGEIAALKLPAPACITQ
jgi:hypothetical protein